MAGNTYRTANGKMLDMRALALKNETVRAVGNMKVNARGDKLDANNAVIKTRPSQINDMYQQEVQLTKGNEG